MVKTAFTFERWAEEILGRYIPFPWPPHAEGGILKKLKEITGKEYPELEKKRAEAVEAWVKYLWVAPYFWLKKGPAEIYLHKVNVFAKAVGKEAEIVLGIEPRVAGVPLETLKKYLLPIGLAGGVTIIAILIWKFKK